MDTAKAIPTDMMRDAVKDCAVKHHDAGECPECGVTHRVLSSLPERPLGHPDFRAIGDSGVPIKPVYRLHIEDEALPTRYVKISPLIFLVVNDTVHAVEYLPETGWIVIEEHDDIDTDELDEASEPIRERLLAERTEDTDVPTITDPRP